MQPYAFHIAFMIPTSRLAVLVLTATVLGRGVASAQGLNLLPGVEELPSDTIADIAVATVDLPQPAIYYNPRWCEGTARSSRGFFIAHEYGPHLPQAHPRQAGGTFPNQPETRFCDGRSSRLTASLPVRRMSRGARPPRRRFGSFHGWGPFRFDAVHPHRRPAGSSDPHVPAGAEGSRAE